MAGEGRARLIGTVRRDAEDQRQPPGWDHVSKRVIERMSINVDRVNWFSIYHVHHRVVGLFRAGRVFLLAHAAHIHSPVGGQGMNTAIGAAVNLPWQLPAVLHGPAETALLDTSQP